MALSPTSSHPGIPSGGTAGGDLTGTYPNPTFDLTKAHVYTGNQTAPALVASGLTGSVAASRYVGATASGAPASGAHSVGDFAIDQTAGVYVCTVAGTPGTWVAVGGSAPTAVTVPISSADLLALGASAKQLVAAPGMGKVLVPTYAAIRYTAGATPYVGTADIEVGLGGVGTPFLDAAMFEFSADVAFFGASGSGFAVVAPRGGNLNPSLMTNVPIGLDNGGNNLTLGNGTALVILEYITVTL